MTSGLKIALLVAGTALIAGAACGETYQHHMRHGTVHGGVVATWGRFPRGQVYLLENRGAAAGNTNAAERFQHQFDVDY